MKVACSCDQRRSETTIRAVMLGKTVGRLMPIGAEHPTLQNLFSQKGLFLV